MHLCCLFPYFGKQFVEIDKFEGFRQKSYPRGVCKSAEGWLLEVPVALFDTFALNRL